MSSSTLHAQGVASGEVFFNYGSASGSISQYYSSSFTVGQPVVGPYFGVDFQGALGFWSRYLVAPAAPHFTASEGDYPDRILLNWDVDPLSPASDQGFKIFRDGAFLAHVDPTTLQFIDFNVIPGVFYNYEIRGINTFGDGYPATAVGFVNPNGLVTGQVSTINNNPVAGVQVTLEPTLGNSLLFDGDDFVKIPRHTNYTNSEMTISCWVKIGDTYTNDAIVDLGQSEIKNWWINTSDQNSSGKGITIGMGEGSIAKTFNVAFAEEADGWHYIAFTYNGSDLNVYLDGELQGTVAASMVTSDHDLFLGKNEADENSNFNGNLDDLRIYSRQLSQTEILRTMNATVPSSTPNLEGYWKFDEGLGYKVFDLTDNQMDGFMTNGEFSDDRPNVLNAGVTDESGFYVIDGINYGGGQTFTARPAKDFEFNNALEFNATNQQYATISNFQPNDIGTIELWMKPSVLTGQQTILHNDGLFELKLNGTDLELSWDGGSALNLGAVTSTEYVHIAMRYDPSTSPNLTTFINGVGENNFTVSPITWDSTEWNLGRNAAGTNYFTGLIDEVVFFNGVRTQAQIQEDAIAIDLTDLDLANYFSLNESVGTALEDQSPNNSGIGTIHGANWTSVTANPKTVPHEFNPNTRVVTLDPSNTSVDNVDFEDISTVSVSGFVIYEGTQCPAVGVEILVDGISNVPPIYTNDDGKFVADFEPGSSFQLSPKFNDHQFIPNFWDINNIVVPKAGIVFKDQEKRDVEGILAGGLCEKSVVLPGDSVVVSLTSTNGCFNQDYIISPGTKKFKFDNVPPIVYTVALTQHTDKTIENYINSSVGAPQIDLEPGDTSVAFIYRSNIKVETTDLPTNDCGLTVLEQNEKYQIDIKVFEQYGDQKCYLDSVILTINDDISGGGASIADTAYHASKYKHKFYAGAPNITPPDYKKTISILAKDALAPQRKTNDTITAIVAGMRKRPTQFTTTSPEIPWLILRDPPGDGSYTSWESGQTQCTHYSQSIQEDNTLSNKTTLHLGAQFESGALFWSTETEITADISAGFTASSAQVSATEEKVCMTASNTISTSSGDLIVGGEMGGDVYVGGAMNLIFGITDVLYVDTASCSIALDTTMSVEQDGMATQYIYSEDHIRKNIIPHLYAVDSIESAELWQQILQKNEDTKANAIFSENYSFDGGVIYEYTKAVETEKAITIDWETTFSNDFALAAGFKIAGNGLSNETTYEMSTTIGGSSGTTSTSTNSVTYHLEDDDPGDNFTVDVLDDEVFGTPVFKIKAGQSSCPHEPGTQHRDEVSITVAEAIQTNVLETEPAIFELTLGNNSPAGQMRTYALGIEQNTNPHGAIIKVNGQALNDIPYTIEAGESAQVTLTLEKGPIENDYENIEIYFYSLCETDRADALGIEPDPLFEQGVSISAYFIPSCSDVNISSPQNGWVVSPNDDGTIATKVPITVDQFNLDHPDLDLIRVQYRPTNGNGAWINVVEVPKDSLGDIFELIYWDITDLSDGDYELRAVTNCIGNLPPGISDVISGRLDREPPALLGTPSPADGILDPADDISIEFTEIINCTNLTSLPTATEDFVGLFDATTGQPIDINISCLDNKIVIHPNIQNKFIENKLLRAEVKGIKDFTDTSIPAPITWEFYVDRNPLKWVEGNIDDVKYNGESWLVTRTIQNFGGQTEIFTLEDVPDWITPSILTGEVAPGGTAIVVFSVPDDIASGSYEGTIQLENAMGKEPLKLDLAVLCPPPLWEINSAAWDYNMTFTLELDIEGTISEDDHDIVAAFIDGELRGIAQVTYVASLDKYLAFLNVYSNQLPPQNPDDAEIVEFRIWDASDCLLYGSILESFPFANDSSVGNPDAPQVLHTQNIVVSEIPLHAGWNWISFNLNMPDKDINTVLSSIENPTDLLIKDQSSVSFYFESGNSWNGSLDELGYISSYQLKGTQNDTITLQGLIIDSDTVDIPIQAGWNWIGYIPQQGAHVNDALASLSPLTGDIIKNQNTFAQYVAGVGWIGSLSFMEAPNGYLLKTAAAGTLNYQNLLQNSAVTRSLDNNKKEGDPTLENYYWDINPADYEYSMTMLAFVSEDDLNRLNENDEVGAFVGNEIRGVTRAIYVEALDTYLLFLTTYANEFGETLTFKYYDAEDDAVYDLNETFEFVPNGNLGTVSEPEILTISNTTSTVDIEDPYYFRVQPNPFKDKTTLNFNIGNLNAISDEVTIRVLDLVGTVIKEEVIDLKSQSQNFELKAIGDDGTVMSPGVYFIQLEGETGSAIQKVLLVE